MNNFGNNPSPIQWFVFGAAAFFVFLVFSDRPQAGGETPTVNNYTIRAIRTENGEEITAWGFGFPMGKKHLVTALHNVTNPAAESIYISAKGIKPMRGELVFRDPVYDLAIIQVPDAEFIPVELGHVTAGFLDCEIFEVGHGIPNEYSGSALTFNGKVLGMAKANVPRGGQLRGEYVGAGRIRVFWNDFATRRKKK